MNTNTPIKRFSLNCLVAGASLLFVVSHGHAHEKEIVIGGQTVTLTESSVKCDLGEMENYSKRRLVNCNSAQLVEFNYDDGQARAIKFTIEPFDEQISSGVRAELRDMHESVNGEEIWYRFATLLPRDFPIDSPHRLVLAQWHERMQEGMDSLRPPISQRLWNGRFVITLWNNERVAKQGVMGDGQILYDIPEFKRGVFHDFIYKVIWSPGAEGRIVTWTRECLVLAANCAGGSDWREIIRYSGSTGYANHEIKSYYFKMGIYTVSEFDVPFTVYHQGYVTGANVAELGLTDKIFQ